MTVKIKFIINYTSLVFIWNTKQNILSPSRRKALASSAVRNTVPRCNQERFFCGSYVFWSHVNTSETEHFDIILHHMIIRKLRFCSFISIVAVKQNKKKIWEGGGSKTCLRPFSGKAMILLVCTFFFFPVLKNKAHPPNSKTCYHQIFLFLRQ